MATAGALEDQELMSEGKNLSLQRCASLKGLPSRRKQRENDRHHVAEKLQRLLPKFNQFSQNVVFGKDNYHEDRTHLGLDKETPTRRSCSVGGGLVTAQPRLGGLHHRYDRAA